MNCDYFGIVATANNVVIVVVIVFVVAVSSSDASTTMFLRGTSSENDDDMALADYVHVCIYFIVIGMYVCVARSAPTLIQHWCCFAAATCCVLLSCCGSRSSLMLALSIRNLYYYDYTLAQWVHFEAFNCSALDFQVWSLRGQRSDMQS